MKRLGICAVLLLTQVALSCVRNPATGKKQFSLVSESQEIQLGQQGAEEARQSIGLYDDAKVQAYVAQLGKKLLVHAQRPNLPWSFQVVDDPSVNAFALPGGPVFVTRGILTYMNSEAELAGVMGHEIGHITARHSANQLSKAEIAQVGLGVGSIFVPQVAQLGGAGLQLLFLKYGRDAETQADELGFGYMLQAGYDPRQMGDMFVTLQRVGEAAGGGLPEWLSTHPDPGNRLQKTEQRVAALNRDLSGLAVDRDTYLAMVDGMVFGEDPRQGFFRGQTFYHPSLKLKLEFPPGWKTQNTPQSVAGMSEKQDALVGMSAAGKLSPEQAAQKFFQQEGVRQAAGASQGDVNGLPAVTSYFEAQTQQGAIAGIVSFVSYGGATWQLVGYTSAQALQGYDSTFRHFITSFGPVTDKSVLDVQPARVKLVKLTESMTLQQFQQRHPSTIPIEQLAIINGVKATDSIPAGTTLKQVVGGPGPAVSSGSGASGAAR
ncbi:M48 family metalloprotease [Aggregicoccus sp. 17bor-14]|uniref:M48 family metalloprotease n=1 Tax=Myxococcaceae TaxID=31 RepID=UPI00129CCE3A|nr:MULTISPECIES: M48 family metallopeptidase [Myxococcaceae]MBF5046495.1 M48 family metalloprotease [Simulacricoccus sp. 17bor-14]MRI92211.1 M48 family metalloprotease [Aggregicoccus sp. 17bor-14]